MKSIDITRIYEKYKESANGFNNSQLNLLKFYERTILNSEKLDFGQTMEAINSLEFLYSLTTPS